MNKPVAHFYPEGEGCTVYDIKFAWKVTGTKEPIPLYTHPVNPYQSITNTKIEPTVVSYTHPAELTDEEIMEIHRQIREKMKCELPPYIEFARAILRKAQKWSY